MRHLAEVMQTTIPMRARFLMIKQHLKSMDSERSELLNRVRNLSDSDLPWPIPYTFLR
jgi:hypothetical protein